MADNNSIENADHSSVSLEPDIYISHYCIKHGRCGLCQFDFELNELVIAALVYSGVSSKFPFRPLEFIQDENLRVEIHVCMQHRCRYFVSETICYHPHCYESYSDLTTPEYLAIAEYSFTPSAKEQETRLEYVHKTLTHNFQRSLWVRNLPWELCLMITDYFTQESAIATTHEQLLQANEKPETGLDLNQPIYASYVKLYDRCYVRRLQNEQPADTDNVSCLILPALAKNEQGRNVELFISEDHVGIRQVVFIPKDRCEEWCRKTPKAPGVWWRHVSGADLPSALCVRSDGFKVRAIERNEKPVVLSPIGWPVPTSTDPTYADLLALNNSVEYQQSNRLRFIDTWPAATWWSEGTPKMIDHSVITDGWNVLAGLIHDPKKPAQGFNENPGFRHFFWAQPSQYQAPLADIDSICRRTGRLAAVNEAVGFSFDYFNTSEKGNTQIDPWERTSYVDWRYESTLADWQSCDVYIDPNKLPLTGHEARLVDFQQDGQASITVTAKQKPLPTVPPFISLGADGYGNGVWLHSHCSMANVKAVTLCVQEEMEEDQRTIIGLRFEYLDGHYEQIGQTCRRWLTETLQFSSGDNLYIKAEERGPTDADEMVYRHKRSAIAEVVVRQLMPDQAGGGRWLQVGQDGRLEWWFTQLHNVLCYQDDRLNALEEL